jgi:type VI secretion system Hcp family effector
LARRYAALRLRRSRPPRIPPAGEERRRSANEVLSEVTLEFVRTQPDGTEAVVYRIKLSNAGLSEIHQVDEGKADQQPYEELSFVFQKIDLTWVDGAISATDSWS